MDLILAGLISYLIGGTPFGVLVARWIAGIDIRAVGSGNTGATNVARSVGKTWGFVVLILDALKGALPTAFVAPALMTGEAVLHGQVLCGICAVVGHMYSIWLRLAGGKGMATAAGVVLVLAPLATLAALVVFVLTFAITRWVSLGSILAAVTFAIYQMWALQPDPFSNEHWSLAAFSLLVPALITYRHRTNIVRLIQGTEPKFQSARGERDSTAEDAASPPA